MVTLIKFLIGMASTIQVLIGLAGLFLSGLFASGIPAELGALISVLPIILVCLAGLGYWSIFKNNRAGQYSYSIVLLLAWPAGTIIGAILIGLLLATSGSASKTPAASN
ncbi:hypothetical protein [Vibrio nitrifigilis]|uniref:Uncharacterized protein n=1 Tax=Vibrio nitrifigilis TaxID=2789781 RepID=A0ABS0GLT4_9VIBR|nr:hypothetical protein [Vibrio nitrifigilis]MBF9003275.1 hypothetical protein [Vibrio nitrifigilis]